MTFDVIAVTDQLYTLCCYDNKTRWLEKKTDLLPSVASHPLTQSARSSMSTFASEWGRGATGEKRKKEKKGKEGKGRRRG